MGPVDIGISHNNNAMITQLFIIYLIANTNAGGRLSNAHKKLRPSRRALRMTSGSFDTSLLATSFVDSLISETVEVR